MQRADPAHFSQQTRQQIMKNVVELESLVYFSDIYLRDCHPRNIILRAPEEDPTRIVFIDFGHALFNRRPDDALAQGLNSFLGQYVSPLLRWSEYRANEFRKWVDWEWEPWLEAEFAHTAAEITSEMRESYQYC